MTRRKTPEEYYQECKEKGLDLPIEDYKGSNVKIKHKCSNGHIYEQIPANHLSGHGCPKCNGIEKKTPEEYYQECKEKGLDLPIEDYKGSNVKIKHKCSNGHIYEQTPTNHLSGHGCPICRTIKVHNDQRKTPLKYINECKKLGLDLPIEDYINKKTKIKHRCNKCGNIYEQEPANHLSGHGCPKCNGIEKKTPEEYYQECKEKGLDLPIEDYKGSNVKIKHKCSNGHIYEQEPHNHLKGQGCPKCALYKSHNKQRKTSEEYYNECISKGIDLPIEEYKGALVKIKHKCNNGHVYKQVPHNHLQDYGCPICNESHGEKYIRNYLDEHDIKYIPQKRFNDLKDKTYLSYDFYLPDYNTLIEYQGIQHYQSVSFNGKEFSNLAKQQEHDNLKRMYAKNNGYKLLELHYSLDTQGKVNKYLKEELKVRY